MVGGVGDDGRPCLAARAGARRCWWCVVISLRYALALGRRQRVEACLGRAQVEDLGRVPCSGARTRDGTVSMRRLISESGSSRSPETIACVGQTISQDGLQALVDPVRAEVALRRGLGLRVDVQRVVGTGVHACLAADAAVRVEVDDAVLAPEQRRDGAHRARTARRRTGCSASPRSTGARPGTSPCSTYFTQVRKTPSSTPCSCLQATVHAWQPMHVRWSRTNPMRVMPVPRPAALRGAPSPTPPRSGPRHAATDADDSSGRPSLPHVATPPSTTCMDVLGAVPLHEAGRGRRPLPGCADDRDRPRRVESVGHRRRCRATARSADPGMCPASHSVSSRTSRICSCGSFRRRAPGAPRSGRARSARPGSAPGASSSCRRAGSRRAGGCRPRRRADPRDARPRRRGR